jgi:hypothetical protein
MSYAHSAPAEFWQLANDKLDGTLSDAGVERLESLLDGDFGLQSLYRNYCQLHINLEAETRAQRVVDHLRATQSTTAHDYSSRDDVSAAANAVDLDTDQAARRHAWRASWLSLATCAAALTFLLAGLAARNDKVQIAHAPLDVAADAGDDNLDIVTVRLSSDESRFLSIGDVGNIHIQGPAHFDLIGTRRAKLYVGRIKVRITDPRGRGFVVETPQGNVTDLGTEFGVDVSKSSSTGVVVFEGSVDLAVSTEGTSGPQVERLVQGEGLNVNEGGRLNRIMAVFTGEVSTFQRRGEARTNGVRPIIVDVFDNIRSADLRKFYEIVPGGMQEDALAYVDRPAHDWSGIDGRGIPSYLVGADYVKPFNSDKMRSDMEISVTLSCPARLFIFADDRAAPPQWLRTQFRDTGDSIGHDCGPYVLDGVEFFKLNRGFGPSNSVDSTFSIWEKIVERPGVIKLGPNFGKNWEFSAMYGIAAIRLAPERPLDVGQPRQAAEPSRIGAAQQ